MGGYGVALLVVAIVGVITYRSTIELIDSADWVAHTHLVKEGITKVLSALKDAETGQRGFLITGEERFLQPYNNGILVADGYVADIRDLTVDNPTQQKHIAVLHGLVLAKLAELAESIAQRRVSNRAGVAQAVLTDESKTLMDKIRRTIRQLDDGENELLEKRAARARATAHFALATMAVGGLVILVMVSITAVFIQRSITVPLDVFMTFVGRVGEGDLTQRAKIPRTDELGKLAESLDGMVDGLKEVAAQTRLANADLNIAAAEILASTQQQAAGASAQAAAIQQTTTTMEEVTQSGVQISDRAREVAASAEATSAISRAGLQAVENTSRSIETIREQAEAMAENVVSLSEKTAAIGQLISTVNDIAEESHLLALNAAIEAAAAGEHGRSFSVIASEVKNLADQSRQATVQVRSILGDIQKGINTSVMLTEEAVKRVDVGKREADVADSTIREMTQSIQQSVQAFQQIVAGSNQQQIGFRQVMQAVRDIGRASQQTAASTSQQEKAAVNLTTLARQLQKAVDRYRV